MMGLVWGNHQVLHALKCATQSSEPYWDEFFVFEVRSPAFAVLRIKVYDHLRCWRPQLVGQVGLLVFLC